LKAYDALAAVVLDASGQPKVVVAGGFPLGHLEVQRALNAPHLAGDNAVQGVCREGLGALRDRSAVPVLLPL
jgi:hypothetical protein